jgi:uncharacterized Zn finger protein
MAGQSKTWWGEEFLNALEGCMDAGRLARGRGYAAPRRRTEFSIRQGEIEATMVGNINPHFGVYETPYYTVKIEFEKVAAARWKAILKRLGSNADWVTHLILGEVPPTIEKAFAGSSIKLLPRTGKEIRSSCSCPDWANPCKHVAGVYFHVAALLDRDPLLLFELRGMDRWQLRQAVAQSEFGAALLGDAGAGDPDLAAALREPRFPAVTTSGSATPASDLRAFWRGKPLPREVTAEGQAPPVSALLLRREGDYPEFWPRNTSFIAAMAAVYERVAKGIPPKSAEGLPDDPQTPRRGT